MERVAIIGPIDEIGKNTIKEGLQEFECIEVNTESEYEEKLKNVQYAILRTLKLKAESIALAPHLKYIQRWGAGFDSVDIVYAGEKNIPVGVLPGVNSTPVAEFTILLMLATLRHLLNINQNIRTGKQRDEGLLAKAYVLEGKIVGLMGMGNIGKKVASRVQSFGSKVIYYDAFRLKPETERKLNVEYVELKELMKKSDVLSIHVPLIDSTRHVINKEMLNLMKPNAIIINTSRGGIIEENDLCEALRSNKILGAGLDVFEQEPASQDNPLVCLDNVVASAHCAGNSIDNSVTMGRLCVENVKKIAQGEKITEPTLVNSKYLKF